MKDKDFKIFRVVGVIGVFRLFRVVGVIGLFRVVGAFCLLAACGTSQPVAHHGDTLRVDRWHYDSIDRWHTRHIFTAGDTVHLLDTFYTDRWHVRLRDSVRLVRDSVPYPVEVEVVRTDRTGWLVAAALAVLCLIAAVLKKCSV